MVELELEPKVRYQLSDIDAICVLSLRTTASFQHSGYVIALDSLILYLSVTCPFVELTNCGWSKWANRDPQGQMRSP